MKHLIHPIRNYNRNLFFYLLFLTSLFILLEVSFFIQRSEIYLGDFFLVSHRIQIPIKILPGILQFVFIQLCLHFLLTLFVFFMAIFSAKTIKASPNLTEKIGFGFWFITIFTILFANQYYFPNSKFASLLNYFLSIKCCNSIFFILLSLLFFLVLLSLIGFFISTPKKYISFGIFVILPMLITPFFLKKVSIVDGASTEKPNIIIIGIDSLRPDFLGFFGYEKQTPHLDRFLNHSTVFANALTPLARTFPAWVSLLSGEFPKVNGVRFNLPILNHFDWQNTLPALLKKRGYSTFFATDEVRFSNIDERFGFDTAITPPIGVNDFLLGDLADFPLTNLLVNTRFGELLFPYSFGNRPARVTYDPNSFLAMVKKHIATVRQKPLFLAIHFCLPHYPYVWGKVRAYDKSVDNYRAAIQRSDQQFNDFLIMLNQFKLLDHAIVIVLSDHGEALELPGDRVTEKELFIPGKNNLAHTIPHFYPASFETEEINQSAGHGTDVLGLTQYHILLAFRLYGIEQNQPKILKNYVSLLNIKPFVLSYLSSRKNNYFESQKINFAYSHFFIESDFSPQAMRTVHPETKKVLFEGVDYFQIDPNTTRVNVKPSMSELIISSKQYADIYGDWILALYPQNTKVMMPILVNLKNGYWTNDLKSQFAKNSPASSMLKALQKFYGNDLAHLSSVCDSN